MNLLFLDTETTGLKLEDRICQIAYKLGDVEGEPNVEFFLPPVPISYEAMSVHHITNDMVADKPVFEGSSTQKYLNDMSLRVIFVAHNAGFDLKMLEKESVRFPIWIDTLRVARHLLDQENYTLQYLRYALDLRVQGTAHDAQGDVNVLIALFEYMMAVLLKEQASDGTRLSQNQAIDKMVTLTNLPVTIKKFGFGKYFGRSIEEVAGHDRQYLSWLYSQEKAKMADEQNEDMLHTLKKYLQ